MCKSLQLHIEVTHFVIATEKTHKFPTTRHSQSYSIDTEPKLEPFAMQRSHSMLVTCVTAYTAAK